MPDTPLNGLIIRTALARQSGLGYIYAADPQKESEGIQHAITFKYQDGNFIRGEANFDAHALALISKPNPGLIAVSGAGYYSFVSAGGNSSGDILDDSTPAATSPRTGGIRSVASIDGKAYAVGLRGMVYRFEGPRQWSRIDDGLPDTVNGQAIHGFSDDEIYVVGRNGAIWARNAGRWQACDSPTSVTLTSVTCASDGWVYAAGHKGVLLRGRGDTWQIIEQNETDDDIWDLEWFMDKLHASTMTSIYILKDNQLVPMAFGDDTPKSCYQLSANGGVMWSNGEFDLMSFDGNQWSRIV